MKEEQFIKLIEWATSENTGISSISICRYMLNLNPARNQFEPPRDKWDRERCIKLLNTIPQWWDRLDEMKRFNSKWSEQIDLIKGELNRSLL